MLCLVVVVETLDCNCVIEGLEVMPALIRTRQNIWRSQMRIIGPARLLCVRIIEAAWLERRRSCTCTAGSHMQFASAKM